MERRILSPKMDQLLAGYISSDDEGSVHKNARTNQTDISQELPTAESQPDPHAKNAKMHALSIPAEDQIQHRPDKRRNISTAEIDKQSRYVANNRCHQITAAAVPAGAAVALAPVPPPVAICKSAAGLPNPLVLLAAGSEEERAQVLAAAARGPSSSLPLIAPPAASRVRSFPHVVGNFPTVVLLPVHGMDEALDAAYRKLRRLLSDLQPMASDPDPLTSTTIGRGRQSSATAARGHHQTTRSSSPSPPPSPPLPPQRGYHVSLSRTVAIRHPQIAPLTTALSERLKAVEGVFLVSLSGWRSFTNDESTRSFASVMVAAGWEQICQLIRGVDDVFGQHGLPPFHKEPLPHVSLGWLPGDQRGRIDAALRCLRPQVATASGNRSHDEAPMNGGAKGANSPEVRGAEEVMAEVEGVQEKKMVFGMEVLCQWQARHAVCVVGQRAHEVWHPEAS